jgi:hypothetical protein
VKAPTWLLAVLLALCGANVLTIAGTASALVSGSVPDLPFAPGVRIALAAAWIVIFALLFAGLIRRRRMAFTWTAPIITLYGVSSVVWNILFARSDYSRGGIGFQALVTTLALIPIWWVALRRGWMRGAAANADHTSA